jgi:cytochrome c-type biogenesis protein CcmF
VCSGWRCSAARPFLWWILFSHQFQYQYVHDYSSRDMPGKYVYAAFWGGQEGTFLLWALLTTTLGLLLMRLKSPLTQASMFFLNLPVIMLTFVGVVRGPFLASREVYADGVGLNPLLQDWWMTIHPPVLFTGFSSFVVPFAIACAALLKRDWDGWVKVVLPWVVLSAAVQATGFIMGGVWAYKVLGWGGYWGWDPVENGSLIPGSRTSACCTASWSSARRARCDARTTSSRSRATCWCSTPRSSPAAACSPTSACTASPRATSGGSRAASGASCCR